MYRIYPDLIVALHVSSVLSNRYSYVRKDRGLCEEVALEVAIKGVHISASGCAYGQQNYAPWTNQIPRIGFDRLWSTNDFISYLSSLPNIFVSSPSSNLPGIYYKDVFKLNLENPDLPRKKSDLKAFYTSMLVQGSYSPFVLRQFDVEINALK